MNEKEKAAGHEKLVHRILFISSVCFIFLLNRIVGMNTSRGVCEVRNPKGPQSEPPKTFTYDAVYDDE
jgi:hypothetical protein